MNMKQKFLNIFIFVAIISLWQSPYRATHADMFYWPSQYNATYNDKVALELELKMLKEQSANAKEIYESKVRQLENTIDALNKKIELLQNQMSENKNLCDRRIQELNNRSKILSKKSSAKEKMLVAENEKLQKRFDDQLKKTIQNLNDEREKNIKDIEMLKNDYEKKISNLEKKIADLNDNLSELKKLTKEQKAELDRMNSQTKDLEKQLEKEISKGDIRLKRILGKLVINLDNRICFDSGSAKLKGEVMPALKKIAKILSNYSENNIVIEGHTDNIPIHTAKYRNSWQLSTERALAVLDYILTNKKLNPVRFSAAGYGEYHPIVSNDSEANRALNRRVDIVVIPRIDNVK